MTRPELADEIFLDLTADLVANKGNRKLLDRASALMAEGNDPPTAWALAKKETGVPTSPAQYARFKEYLAMHDMGGGPALAKAPDLPRTPIAQAARISVISRGDQAGSGLLTDDPELAQKVSDWIERETKRRGYKPSWKEGLLAVTSGRGSAVSASESSPPVRADSQRGFRWSWSTGWDRVQPDPVTVARQVALAAVRNEPEIIKGAESTAPLGEKVLATMKARGQSVDPKSATFCEDYKKTILELSQ